MEPPQKTVMQRPGDSARGEPRDQSEATAARPPPRSAPLMCSHILCVPVTTEERTSLSEGMVPASCFSDRTNGCETETVNLIQPLKSAAVN